MAADSTDFEVFCERFFDWDNILTEHQLGGLLMQKGISVKTCAVI